MKVTIKNLEALDQFSINFCTLLKPGVVVALDGDLGLGKTTFVKMCAKHLGIKETVDSPTFTILKSYENPLMHHIDAYRLEGTQDIFDIEDAIYDEDAYIFVEWASFIEPMLPKNRVHITFSLGLNQIRLLTIRAEGDFDVKSLLSN